ncbi:transcriptional regulator with XRE-family HTH domain [Bradyrhizobium sp. USDA 3686]|uniref:helix-turn-helix domain-containing protein n=1 Tax=Bradyrhizobium canariense TaxID=255045 RepID=UPI001956B599|nr:helix-turn-helix transcriptional regulator [Bradyrhizobium canariense]MBM7483348.1 transcriptional regulator with XRE-family HTH domain [Bradyrhizobium canariense]
MRSSNANVNVERVKRSVVRKGRKTTEISGMAPKSEKPKKPGQPTEGQSLASPQERLATAFAQRSLRENSGQPTEEQPRRQLRSREERIKLRNDRLAALRERSGLSMDELAREMGFKGQSSIQRYLSPTYDKGFRPEIAARFKAAFVGRGEPPITTSDMDFLDNWAETADGDTVDILSLLSSHLDAKGTSAGFEEQLADLGLHPRSRVASVLTRMKRLRALEIDETVDRVAGLPLAEGDVLLKIPKHISAESVETLRDWLEHMISLSLK